MNNKALTTTDLQDFRVAITPDALQRKSDALQLSTSIVSVSTIQQQSDAVAAGALLKGLIKRMEETREEVKKPALEAGRAIDAAAKGYSEELTKELKRVEGLAAEFQKEEDRRAAAIKAEEERKQREAREVAEAERRKEQESLARIAAEAERERRAALAKIQAAKDESGREAAQKEADRLAEARAEEVRINQAACREAAERRAEEERQRIQQMQSIQQSKPEGATVKRMMDYELKDLRALYAARPDLVELKEKRAMILAAIAIPNAPAIPGLYVFESTKVQSRAS